MKFLIVASYPKSIFKFRGDLIKDLLKKGFEVHIATPIKKEEYNDQDLNNLRKLDVRIHKYSINRRGVNVLEDLFTIFQLGYIFLKVSPDFILAYTIKPVIYGMIMAFITRIPNRISLITGLGISFTKIDDKQKFYTRKAIRFLYKISLNLSTKNIFQNKDDKKLFEKLNIVKTNEQNYVINGSGVNLSFFQKTAFPKNLSFLFIGRFLKSKGLIEFIEAARAVKSEFQEIKFYIAGSIENEFDAVPLEYLTPLIENKIIENLGYINDVRTAIKNSSVYVLPSYREGTPRSVLEAMAMGRPIITTDAPGCRETVINGFNGFQVEVGSTKELVDAMKFFKNNPKSIKEMGNNSLEIVKEKYDVRIVNNKMLDYMGII